jgi:hypothetical protein
MEFDYPAAHSMDTVWYAVDDAGHVAAFLTGENGSVPDGAGPWRLLLDLHARTFQTDPNAHPDWDEAAASLGVFKYGYNDEMPLGYVEPRYRREVAPDSPLHVDQLPPDFRKEWKRLQFPGVRFDAAEYLQPYEFFRCTSYDVDASGYLSGDGTTIRPIPGTEEDFAEAIAGWREEWPDAAAGYRFEGPADGT